MQAGVAEGWTVDSLGLFGMGDSMARISVITGPFAA